jgi:heptosyltransferase-2
MPMNPCSLQASHLLLFSPNWLGDVVMALPAYQQWRAGCPGTRVTVLAKPSVAPLWPYAGGVDTVIPLRPGRRGMREAVRAMRAARCDAALLLPHSFRAGWLAWRAGIAHRRGTTGQGRRLLVNDPVSLAGFADQHQQFELFHLFGLAPATPPAPPRLTLPDALKQAVASQVQLVSGCRQVAILPGAARGESKRWPAGHFAAAARGVFRQHSDIRFLICGTAAEAPACKAVADELGPLARNLAGQTRLPELAALLAQCAAVCCNDSGGMHLASAVGVPVVAVFGLTDPAKTGPLGHARVVAPAGVRAARAIPRVSPEAARALASIDPDRVTAALLEVMQP